MSLIEIFTIIFTHFVGDFVFQTHWQASNKSKDNYALSMHVLTYTLTWIIPIFLFNFFNEFSLWILLFLPITFIFHWVTDYITSRINSKLWKEGKIHDFFVSIGFDQVLHYLQLFITYQLLK